MRINSLELRNIRSYERESVRFPEGSVLLSGDIGSGKSSLLIAIEFTLFGIKRGELSGEALLRRGKKHGMTRLNFTVDGKDVTIERNLTKTPSGVRQESGSIIIDGVRREGTPTELKATVLDLLGYPPELLQMQKSLLYRFTVYTPQEEMKEIIKAERERRLDTLRKLFGVERYKTVKENVDDFLKAVRSKKRELNRVFRDLDEKRIERRTEQKRRENAKISLKTLKVQEKNVQEKLRDWTAKRKSIEEQILLFNKFDKELGQADTNQKNLELQMNLEADEIAKKREKTAALVHIKPKTAHSLEELEESIASYSQEREQILKNPQDVDKATNTLLQEKEDILNRIAGMRKRIVEAQASTNSLNESLQKLVDAKSVCPVCGQKLDEKHKHRIIKEYRERALEGTQEVKKLESQLETLAGDLKSTEQAIEENVDKHLDEIRKKVEDLKKNQEILRNYNEKMKERNRLEDQIKSHVEKVDKLRTSLSKVGDLIQDLKEKLEKLEGVTTKKKKIDGQIDELNIKFRDISNEIAKNETLKEGAEENLKKLEKEIAKREEAAAFNSKLSQYESWLEDYFVELTGTVEKHFMLELRRRFDPLFKDWFNLLIDDELLNVRIDDDFAPIINQEGYEAEYENLSGGESASVALAYRLALNKVVNTLIEEIKLSDIIILDEPTDGFSHDQLDKIRDIIAELNIPQTIIVSHEPKVESYVENVIRIRKDGGVSRVLKT